MARLRVLSQAMVGFPLKLVTFECAAGARKDWRASPSLTPLSRGIRCNRYVSQKTRRRSQMGRTPNKLLYNRGAISAVGGLQERSGHHGGSSTLQRDAPLAQVEETGSCTRRTA